MSTARELNQVFDIVEELVGIDPSTEDLTNAIHAVITKDSDRVLRFRNGINILMRVEDLARQYETVRKIHQYS